MTQDESTAGPDDFEQWLDERPRWIQASAARLIEAKRRPNQTELGELVNLCIREANGEDCSAYPLVIPGTMAQAALRPTISIRTIDEVQSVNALRDGATLTFDGSGLTVVYGKNGSGKTGFSRIVKHAAGARHKGDLHSNVFKDIGQETKARITYAVDGVEREPVTWKLQSGPIPHLRSAEMYVTSENEATYEPSRMRFISSLIKISDDVAALLREAKEQKVPSLHQLPPEFVATTSGKWLKSLSDKTTEADVESSCTYTKELDDERIASEAAIAQKNIDSRLTEIAKDRLSLLKAGNMLNTLKTSLSDDAISKIVAARSTAQFKRAAASEDAKKVFGSAPIHGVGEQSWLDLWEQARMFSTHHAYPQQNFPFIEDHARCVLCQQSLNDDARARLAAFEEFVCKGLEKSAKIAESELASLLSGLPTVPEESDWLLQVTAFRVDEDVAKVCLKSLRVRVDTAKSSKQGDVAPSIYFQPLEQALSSLTSALSAEETSLKELQKDGKRKEMEARVLELRAKQWLSQNKKSINEERVRKQEIALLERAIGITNTAPLTMKNNKLAQTELDAGYQKRFSEELDKLGNKLLPIKPSSKFIGKGRVTFGLELIGVKQQVRAHEILSEGENRVIALAAFLADITGSNQRSPFIFDDPVSSLDQDHEESVVARLVDLARTRQVIVFTHRLSLVALIEDAVKKIDEVAKLEKKQPAVTLKIETLMRFGEHVGLISEIRVRDAHPKKALNRLKSEVIPQLHKLLEGGHAEEYQMRAEGLCTDFRIILERCVENILFNDVLSRFRRSIKTMGKIGGLAKIQAKDCTLIDDLMTRYSVFEHSQSSELPAKCPNYEVLKADVETLSNWIEEFGSRAVI